MIDLSKFLKHEYLSKLQTKLKKLPATLQKLTSTSSPSIRIPPLTVPLGQKTITVSSYALLQGLMGITCFYLALFFLFAMRNDGAMQNIDDQLGRAAVDILTPTLSGSVQSSDNKSISTGAHRALPRVPIQGLYETGPYGALPKIDLDLKTTAYENYKRPFSKDTSVAPFISLVMLDYAISPRLSERALQILPEDVSVVLSPYSRQSDDYLKTARHDGHEVWLELPIETKTYPASDPGPHAILSRTSLRYNIDQTEWHLSRSTGYAGVVLKSDDIFDNAEPMFRSVIRELYDRGLGVFEANAQEQSTIPRKVANLLRTPYLKADLNLNNERSRANRDQAFEILETIASAKGYAVATFEPHPETLLALDSWIRSLEQKGFRLAPLSASVGKFNLTPSMLESVKIRQEQAAESKRIVTKKVEEKEGDKKEGEEEKGDKDGDKKDKDKKK